MLLIVSPSKNYIEDVLKKVKYKKEENVYLSEVFSCNYNNHNFIIATTGYGKVNIASSIGYICKKYNIKAIIAVGTAGSINDSVDIFSTIIPISTLQFDVDFTPNGYEPGQIPEVNKNFYKTDPDLNECIKRACNLCSVNYSNDIIASSDMFVSNYNLANSIRREYNAVSCDCESGVIGQFCYINNISYACIKVISNFANNYAIKQYNSYDDEASRIAQRITNKFLKEFYEA